MTEQPRLPDHVHENIEAIATQRIEQERSLSAEQRAVEALTHWIGRPRSLYVFGIIVVVWMTYNSLAGVLHVRQLDPAPFFILQGVVGIYAALMTTMILATQNRQSRDARRNAHLDLQVNILSEQRTAKIVALLEELRRDLPNVRNRVDPIAEALQETVPAHAMISALEETMTEPHDLPRASTPLPDPEPR
ncbi:MAG: DUF1003 domain-containing protein [Pseudomonadota bacterium]